MKIYGVMGDERVVNSLSPLMHNAAFAAHGIKACYGVFPVGSGQVAHAMAGVQALGIAGINITAPYKQAVIGLMAKLGPEAKRLGAVNTVVNNHGELAGHNTDVPGFAAALSHAGFDPAGARCLLIGPGGAARAAARALLKAGAGSLVVAGRDLHKAQSFCQDLGGEPANLAEDLDREPWDLVVNASRVSEPGVSLQLEHWAGRAITPATKLAVDLNYGRSSNIWQDAAQKAGVQFQDGLVLLAQQAALSFAIWTGLDPEPERFMQTLGIK